MQKDYDFTKELMLELQASGEWVEHIWLDEDDPESAKRYYHAQLLADAGALEVTGRDRDHFRITDQGHTLLGVMELDDGWPRIKAAALGAGARGMDVLLSAAQEYALAKFKSYLGLE